MDPGVADEVSLLPHCYFTAAAAEIRLSIYRYCSSHSEGGNINFTKHIKPIAPKTKALGSLSRTCKQIHDDVDDLLYHDRFQLDISTGVSPWYPRLAPNLTTFDFLSRSRKLYVNVVVVEDRAAGLREALPQQEREALKNMCSRLVEVTAAVSGQRSELNMFSFHVGVYGHDGEEDRASKRDLMEKLYKQGTFATREGMRAGKNAVQMEADYAARAMEMLLVESGVESA